MKLHGLVNPTARYPNFLIPVFGKQNDLRLQDVDGDGKIACFRPCDGEPEISGTVNLPDIDVDVGDEPIFAFGSGPQDFICGTKAELSGHLKRRANKLSDAPFVRGEVFSFLGDTAGSTEANLQASKLLADLNPEIAEQWLRLQEGKPETTEPVLKHGLSVTDTSTTFSLAQHRLSVSTVHHNLSPSALYEHAIRFEKYANIAENGALVVYSGAKTGRSPRDKRVVESPGSKNDIWWGPVNIPFDEHTFQINRQRALDYLNTRERLYCFDGFAGWDPNYRMKVRVICSRPYHALFMNIMLIRPTKVELANFGDPDFVIYNAGAFPANRLTTGMGSNTSIDLSIEDRELVILGTEYAGEMKKGVFTVVNYFAPKRGVLSMHCSATANKETGASSLLFGLSRTGKTTLSADPKRHLIGDDEHCWSDDGIFNIEGGCYAKAINLTPESEPDIFQALRFGAVIENVVLGEAHDVDYTDTSITQNTRGAYPIEFIANAKIPCVAGHPTDVIFLTCDAIGVLPPVAALSPAHAMYHFINGYTAKVAGAEMGVTEPQVTFSPCFGGPFHVWHPSKYAEMLAEKLRKHNTRVWLVNTGWAGGACGVGNRISLKNTRAIVDAIHSGALAEAKTERDPIFGFEIVTEVPEVPSEILNPRNAWEDKAAYDATARKLADLFNKHFETYAAGASNEVKAAAPVAG